jgi:capsular polysaccharide biosynthesis protein
MPDTHLELLSMFCKNPTIVLPRGHGVRVRRLLYAPTPTFMPVYIVKDRAGISDKALCPMSVRSYRYMKSRVEAAIGTTPNTGAKYYLTRINAQARKIVNEGEVRDFLESHGFETIMLEKLTFEEQVRVFQRAGTILAPNGSGMQNFIFSPTSVRLFVVTQGHVHNLANFNGQARALGFDPQFIFGDAVGDRANKHISYRLPLEALAPVVA